MIDVFVHDKLNKVTQISLTPYITSSSCEIEMLAIAYFLPSVKLKNLICYR